jgi:hypothetical protein
MACSLLDDMDPCNEIYSPSLRPILSNPLADPSAPPAETLPR